MSHLKIPTANLGDFSNYLGMYNDFLLDKFSRMCFAWLKVIPHLVIIPLISSFYNKEYRGPHLLWCFILNLNCS